MKYTNNELIGIMSFLNVFDNKKLPQKILYAVIKNKILFSKEYAVYEEAIKKIMDNYKDKFILGKDKQPIINRQGIPLVVDEVKEDYEKDIKELLQIEVEIEPYTIPESYFDYEDKSERFDSLTPNEVIMMMNLMCPKDEKGDIK